MAKPVWDSLGLEKRLLFDTSVELYRRFAKSTLVACRCVLTCQHLFMFCRSVWQSAISQHVIDMQSVSGNGKCVDYAMHASHVHIN